MKMDASDLQKHRFCYGHSQNSEVSTLQIIDFLRFSTPVRINHEFTYVFICKLLLFSRPRAYHYGDHDPTMDFIKNLGFAKDIGKN